MKRSTLVAALVLVLLGGYVYWTERPSETPSDPDAVFDVTPDEIERIEIQGSHADAAVIVERHDEGFRLVAPDAAPADPDEVALLLDNLSDMRFVRTIEDDGQLDLETFGLDNASLTVRFQTASTLPTGIRFGKDTLTPRTQYAQRLDSADVLVVADHLSNNLRKSAWQLRDKSLFARDDVRSPVTVMIERHGEHVTFERLNGKWRLLSPVQALGDAVAIERLVHRVRTAQMVQLPEDEAEPLASFGLDPPPILVEVSFAEGEPVSLELGAEKSIDIFARVMPSGGVFLIEGGLSDELTRPSESFVSKRLLDHSVDEIAAIRIAVSERAARVGAGPSINSLLRVLTTTNGTEIVTLLPSVAPSYEVTISTNEAETEIVFYEPREGYVYANRAGESVALRIPTEIWIRLDELLATALAQGGA